MTKATSASRYVGNRKPTNLVMDSEVVEAAKAYFATTRDGSVSAFVERQLRAMLRRDAAKVRAKGIKIPAVVFDK
jgi:hypothetical protein